MDQEQQSRILDLLFQVTKSKRIKWAEVEPDKYQAKVGAETITISFCYPLLADETPSGADIVKVSIKRVEMSFANGTEGMQKIQKILISGVPYWKEHSKMIQSAEREAIALLENLL